MPQEQTRVRIGTFNAFNLASPYIPYYDKYQDEDVYAQKIEWIAMQLNKMAADIVGFQEVIDQNSFEHALSAAGDLYKDAHYRYAEMPSRGGTYGPGLGIVSKYPINHFKPIMDFPDGAQIEYRRGMRVPVKKFVHPVIHAQIEFPGGHNVHVFVVHLKSRRPDFDGLENENDPHQIAVAMARTMIQRTAEAVALRYLLLEVMKGTNTPVILLGDMNADVATTTSEILAGSPPFSSWSGRRRFAVMDVQLYSVKDLQILQTYHDVYYTYVHNGHFQAIDHIYVSEEFVEENDNHIGYIRDVKVFNDHLIDYPRLGERIETWKSDHGQVIADIVMR